MKRGFSTGLAVFLTALIMAGGAGAGWYYMDQQQKIDQKSVSDQISDLQSQITALKKTSADAAATSSTSSDTATVSADPYLYTNATYDFSLLFNTKWKGYQLKTAKIEGSTATYYVCVPTTDADYKKATSTSLAGTASLFAISVYTAAQWTAANTPDNTQPDTKLGTRGNWTIAWSHAQAYPDALVTIANDIKTVVATFMTTK